MDRVGKCLDLGFEWRAWRKRWQNNPVKCLLSRTRMQLGNWTIALKKVQKFKRSFCEVNNLFTLLIKNIERHHKYYSNLPWLFLFIVTELLHFIPCYARWWCASCKRTSTESESESTPPAQTTVETLLGLWRSCYNKWRQAIILSTTLRLSLHIPSACNGLPFPPAIASKPGTTFAKIHTSVWGNRSAGLSVLTSKSLAEGK